jgi:MoaA/NifB/PqqE/SkfB family radical SAM enzyme
MISLKKFIEMSLLYLSRYSRFFLNFIEPNPIEASIKVTERCNSRCITCNVWKSKPKNELTTQEIENVFHRLKEIGIKIIGFTGGECLLRNDIGELIEKAKKIVGAKVYIITNGILLEEKAKILLEKGVAYISVSLDGIGKTDEKIRGVPGHYDKVIKGIKILKELAKKTGRKIDINIGTTLVKPNLLEVPKLIELCKELGVTWSYNLLDTSLYFFKNIDTSELLINDEDSVYKIIDYLFQINKKEPAVVNLDPISLEFAKNYLMNKKPHFYCTMGYFRIFINPNLDVYSGCWALPPIGNLRQENLKDILKSKRYRERLKTMFELKCPRCTCGHIISLKINHLPLSIMDAIKNIRKYKKYFKFV